MLGVECLKVLKSAAYFSSTAPATAGFRHKASMFRSSKLVGLAALTLLVLGQSVTHAHAATASAGFAVSVRVAAMCEAAGACGTAAIHQLDASGHVSATGVPTAASVTVTPLAPNADSVAGQRIDTPKGVSNGPVEVVF
jgi:hypothetical protein